MIFILFFLLFYNSLSGEIILDPANKLQNMLIYINDDVPEENGRLLSSIKDHVGNASKSLLIATNNLSENRTGVQFGTVIIRVPESWNVSSDLNVSPKCNLASFFVTSSNNDKEKPFTKQLGSCGNPGEYTRFPKSYFKTKDANGMLQSGKEIMNEFVKLRYGVFSEKPYCNVLTVFNGTSFIDSVCGFGIKWETNRNKMECIRPNENCRYYLNQNQNHNHSVMFDTETMKSNLFCDNKKRKHNSYAMNLQNIKCNGESVSSVILRHSDFKSIKNQIPFEKATFVVVKGQSNKLVFVLDISGSMTQYIDKMKKAVVEYLNKVEGNISIGIVTFSDSGVIQSRLLDINIKVNRDNLIAVANKISAGGSTNIPDGLSKGIEVLNGSIATNDKLFGTIVLLSDGDNNVEQPPYDYVINQIIKKGVVVNVIAYGQQADTKMIRLSKETGGNVYYTNVNDPYVDLVDKLSFRQSCDVIIDRDIKIIEEKIKIRVIGEITLQDLAYIDEYVGINIIISITISITKKDYIISIVSPRNKTFNITRTVVETNWISLIFSINGKIEYGLYRLKIVSTSTRFKRSPDNFDATFAISAKPESTSQRIINPIGKLSTSEIDLISDSTIVTVTVDLTTCGILDSESVKITFQMTNPLQILLQRSMFDDGLGGDSVANDQIYSTNLYPKDINEIGFYDLLANLEIKNKTGKDIIKRTVQMNSLKVNKKAVLPITDKIPPARILTITLSVPDPSKKLLKIEFLAPGNDGMIGNISKYRITIKCYESKIEIEGIVGVPAREKAEIILDLRNNTVTNPFEVYVQGIDDSNNIGELSPPQMYNWNYQDIYDKFYKDNSGSGSLYISLGTIIACLCIVFQSI